MISGFHTSKGIAVSGFANVTTVPATRVSKPDPVVKNQGAKKILNQCVIYIKTNNNKYAFSTKNKNG